MEDAIGIKMFQSTLETYDLYLCFPSIIIMVFKNACELSFLLFVLLDQTVNDSDVHNVVLSYLVHNCFKDTVESLIASTGLKQAPDHLKDMDKRKRKQSFLTSFF